MAYTRRQELMCTEAQMRAKPNVVLRDKEAIYIKMNDGTLRQKIGDGVTTIISLPFTKVFDGSVVQTTGNSKTVAMSQKAVTESTAKLGNYTLKTINPNTGATNNIPQNSAFTCTPLIKKGSVLLNVCGVAYTGTERNWYLLIVDTTHTVKGVYQLTDNNTQINHLFESDGYGYIANVGGEVGAIKFATIPEGGTLIHYLGCDLTDIPSVGDSLALNNYSTYAISISVSYAEPSESNFAEEYGAAVEIDKQDLIHHNTYNEEAENLWADGQGAIRIGYAPKGAYIKSVTPPDLTIRNETFVLYVTDDNYKVLDKVIMVTGSTHIIGKCYDKDVYFWLQNYTGLQNAVMFKYSPTTGYSYGDTLIAELSAIASKGDTFVITETVNLPIGTNVNIEFYTEQTEGATMPSLLKKPTITLIGDSIVHGYGASDFAMEGGEIGTFEGETKYRDTGKNCWGNRFVNKMLSDFGITCINNGVGTWGFQHFNSYFDQLVSAETDVVICCAGINNRGVSVSQFKAYIETFVDKCAERGVSVIMLSPIDVNDLVIDNGTKPAQMNAIIKDVCRTKQVPYYDLYNAFNLGIETSGKTKGDFYIDQLHPNDAGYKLMFYIICNLLNY